MPDRKSLKTEQVTSSLQRQLLTLENNLHQEKYSLADIGDIMPSVVLVDNLVHPRNEYMNPTGCEILQCTREELFLLGDNYYKDFFHPSEMPAILQQMEALLKSGDTSKVISFYQRVRPNQKTPFEWFHVSCKIFRTPATEAAAPSSLILTANSVNDMGSTAIKINRLIEETVFASENYHLFAKLTRREKEILQHMALGHRSKEIAELFNIALLTVEQHRKNIRRKLEIKSFAELLKFALAFDLI